MKKKTFLKNSKKLLAVILALVCLVLLCSSCKNAEHLELTPEETHRFCETYGEDVLFWKGTLHGVRPVSPSLEDTVRIFMKYPQAPLCLFEIKSVEKGKNEGYFFPVIEVKKVYSGDTSLEGAEDQQGVIFMGEGDLSHIVGKKYLGWVQPGEAKGEIILEQWTFLVTEDNRLVSTYGCQVEEAQAETGTIQMMPGEYYSDVKQESREYTGQTLEYFVEKVKSLEEEYLKEEAEKSETE